MYFSPAKKAAAVLLFSSAFLSCRGCRKEAPIPPLGLAGKDAVFALVAENMGKLASGFSEITSIFREESLKKDIESLTGRVTTSLGFNPFRPDGLAQAGINPASSLVLAIDAGGSAPYLVIGVADHDKASNALKTIARNTQQAESVEKTDHEGAEIFTISRVSGSNKLQILSYAFKGGNMIVVPSDKGGGSVEKLKQVLSRTGTDGLDKSELYASLTRNIAAERHLLVFASRWLIEALPSKGGRKIGAGKLLRGFGAGLNLTAAGVSADVFLGVSKDLLPEVIPLLRSGTASPAYPAIAGQDALLLVKVALNPAGAFEEVMKSDPDGRARFDAVESDLKKNFNLSLKADLIDNLTGNAMLAYYLGDAAFLKGLNLQSAAETLKEGKAVRLIVVAQVKDAAKAAKASEKIAAAMKKAGVKVGAIEAGGRKIYSAMLPKSGVQVPKMKAAEGVETLWAVTESDIFLSLDVETMKKALSTAGQPETAGASRFAEALSNPEMQLLNVSFGDLSDKVRKALSEEKPKDFSELTRQAIIGRVLDVVSHLGELTLTGKTLQDGMKVEANLNLR